MSDSGSIFAPGALGKRQRYEVLRGELKAERSSFEPDWRDIADHIAPRRLRLWSSDTNRGGRRNQKIIDNTPVLALRTMRAGMMSGITSPARPWFQLVSPDSELNEYGPVKSYLDEVRNLMSARFQKSNLYQALPTLYGDMGAFGTGAILVSEDDQTTIRCTPFCVGEYYIANDDKLRVRVFLREFQFTVRQLVRRFGRFNADGKITDWSNFSPAIKTHWESNRHGTWIQVVHVVQENPEFNPNALHSRYKRFTDCYYESASRDAPLLREGGFDEWPILAGRWEAASGDAYATDCPGITAIGDIKQLQHGERNSAQILDKINKPPMIAHTDMQGRKLSQLPGDVTYVDETKDAKFRPAYDVSGYRFDLHEQKLAQVRSRIDRAFFADLFLLLSQSTDPRMTATEILERKEEKLLALGPMLENLNQDVLDPLVGRTFGIMDRRGELPPAPKELEGQALRVDYVSVMAQAQKAIARSGLQGFVGFITPLAQTSPEVLDKVDLDQLVDEAGDMYGVPAKIIVPDDQVQQKRQARAQQQQAAQQAQTAQTAASAAQTLSQTDTSGKNALTDILGNLGGAASGSMGGALAGVH
jgi:hypothetical protein